MSVNWRQSEICIAIYDKPQGSTAKHLSWDALLHYNLSFNLLAKKFLKSANIWQRRTRRTSCCSADSKRPHRCCHTPIKVENIDGTPDIPCTLQLVGRCPPKIAHSPGGFGRRPSNMWLLVPPRVHSPNSTSIGSAVFVGPEVVTCYIGKNRPCTAMWPNQHSLNTRQHASQTSPPTPFARWTRLVSAPAVTQHTNATNTTQRGCQCADNDAMTSLAATVSTCLHMAHCVEIRRHS